MSEVDLDYALALSLQYDEPIEEGDEVKVVDERRQSSTVTCFSSKLNSEALSIVDESWELIDPNPDIHQLFIQFNREYFWGQLDGVEVRWSPRMTLCAGLCCYEGKGGLCSVRLSLPLLKLRPRRDLVQTLLHEMIHALLFVTQNNKDHDSHGPEFHKHMYRINKMTGTNITVYHNFHDEVNEYRQHVWQCDGPCRQRPPFFGVVRRAMNRKPSPNDFWWAEHQKTCGGTYTKVHEPENYKAKRSKRTREHDDLVDQVKEKKGKNDKECGNLKSIDSWFKKENNILDDSRFPGKGFVLGGVQSLQDTSKRRAEVKGAVNDPKNEYDAIFSKLRTQQTNGVKECATITSPKITLKQKNVSTAADSRKCFTSVTFFEDSKETIFKNMGTLSDKCLQDACTEVTVDRNNSNVLTPRRLHSETASPLTALGIKDECSSLTTKSTQEGSSDSCGQLKLTSFLQVPAVRHDDPRSLVSINNYRRNHSTVAIERIDEFIKCPVCSVRLKHQLINEHLDSCLSG